MFVKHDSTFITFHIFQITNWNAKPICVFLLRYSTHLFFHSRIPPELLIPRVAFHHQLFLLNNQESHVKCQKSIKKWSCNYNFTFILYLAWHWSFYSCFKRCFIKGSGSLFSHYIRFNGDCILLKTIATVHASQITTLNQKRVKLMVK